MIKETLYQKLEETKAEYQKLSAMLESDDIIKDLTKFKESSKAFSKLKPIHDKFLAYEALTSELNENEALLNDSEIDMQLLAEAEKQALSKKIETLIQELEILVIPEDPDDERNVFVEIRAAAGGAEAALFAGDLLNMYIRYAENQGWSSEIINSHASEQGGYKEAFLKLEGNSVYSHLKFESGAHRVQRVPETESQGRLHTSTCTVAVLPEVEDIDAVEIHPDELRIDTYRASGAGGQHVQKTDSAVRITHLPTKLKVECQDERSQHKNRERALSLLKARLLSTKREQQQQAEATTRRNLVGTGNRSERIRTYNIPQGRLTDHRIPITLYQLSAILQGKLDLIIDPLKHHQLQDQ